MIGRRSCRRSTQSLSHHPDAPVNLDCGYCTNYDDVSRPVPLEEMKRRLTPWRIWGRRITISGRSP